MQMRMSTSTSWFVAAAVSAAASIVNPASACIRLTESSENGCASCSNTACSLCNAGDCPGTTVVCNKKKIADLHASFGFDVLSQVFTPCSYEYECVKAYPESTCDDASNPCLPSTSASGSGTDFVSVAGFGTCWITR